MDKSRINIENNYNRFIAGINSRCKESLRYIDNSYPRKIEFYNVNIFSKNLIRLVTGQNQLGAIIKFFAAADSMMELENSLNLAFSFQYKSAFDSLRRALEITILGVYYDFIENDAEKISNWVNSQTDTPYFSKMLEKIITVKEFKDLNEKFAWRNDIKSLYWKISDYSHTRGIIKSITELNKVNFSGTTNFNNKSLKEYLNNYIEIIENIAIIHSVNNPILLEGLPTSEKYGFEVPSGLFDFDQAENLKKIIPSKYKVYLEQLVKRDNSIQKRIESIRKMPTSKKYIEIQELVKKK